MAIFHPGVAAHIGVAGTLAGSNLGKVTTAATTEVVIRDSIYLERSVGSRWSVVSTSLLDNGTIPNTGAHVMRIKYYTLSSGTISGPFIEDVTLNGTTAVNTVATNLCYLEVAEVINAGSTGLNQGNINFYDNINATGTNFAQIKLQERMTFYGHHYIPSGKTCCINSLSVSSTATTGNNPLFRIRYNNPAVSTSSQRVLLKVSAQGSVNTLHINYDNPKIVTGPAVITSYVLPTNGGSQVNRIDFGYYEI